MGYILCIVHCHVPSAIMSSNGTKKTPDFSDAFFSHPLLYRSDRYCPHIPCMFNFNSHSYTGVITPRTRKRSIRNFNSHSRTEVTDTYENWYNSYISIHTSIQGVTYSEEHLSHHHFNSHSRTGVTRVFTQKSSYQLRNLIPVSYPIIAF